MRERVLVLDGVAPDATHDLKAGERPRSTGAATPRRSPTPRDHAIENEHAVEHDTEEATLSW